jgi:hypothetical protein
MDLSKANIIQDASRNPESQKERKIMDGMVNAKTDAFQRHALDGMIHSAVPAHKQVKKGAFLINTKPSASKNIPGFVRPPGGARL